MARPTEDQIGAVTAWLKDVWDRDETKLGGDVRAYREIAQGIADMIIHAPTIDILVDYLGVLESQLCLPPRTVETRLHLARTLDAVVRGADRDPASRMAANEEL